MIGVHQKIDRIAHRHVLKVLTDPTQFPAIKDILYFEGKNGPDGIKSKSPARDEPWHYIDPTDASDIALIVHINDHMANLVTALAGNNQERAAFEAAWLSHTLVDGLTPAHHYPLKEKLSELSGLDLADRTTYRKKLVMPGNNNKQRLKNNWEFWGAKGVMTTHVLFEIGIATTMAPLKLTIAKPSANEYVRVEQEGIVPLFYEALHHIYSLGMYDTFHKKGWNSQLARQTRTDLAPTIIKIVTLAWYEAVIKARDRKPRTS